MVECSDMAIIAADATKIGKKVFAKIIDASKTDVLVTTKTDKSDEVAELEKLGVKVYQS